MSGCFVLFWQHMYNSIQYVVDSVNLRQLEGRTHHGTTKQPPKPNFNHKTHINSIKGIPKTSSSGDQREFHRVPQVSYHRMSPHEVRESKQMNLICRNKQEESPKMCSQKKTQLERKGGFPIKSAK